MELTNRDLRHRLVLKFDATLQLTKCAGFNTATIDRLGVKSRTFQDYIVYDDTEPCPYLPGQTARMPLAIPSRPMTGDEADRRFAAGQRRSGEFVYTTECPSCNACRPLRVDVGKFRPNSSQRKAWRRGVPLIRSAVAPLANDQQHIELFNLHRQSRGLERATPVDMESYSWGLGRSCFDAFEIDYFIEDRLMGVAICDRGRTSLSAVYTYYDPAFLKYSPGTYSILRQIEYCRENQMQFLYLGFFIAQSPHMAYKSNFRPHQRLCGGQWTEFE